MADRGRTLTERLRGWVRWAAPYRALFLRERDDHARTRAALAVAEGDRDAIASHLRLAIRQRDTARVLLTGVQLAEPAGDIGAEVEAFLRGEGPA